MSIYIDTQYINQISSRLDKFKWKKTNHLANFRCCICGDSAKSKLKKRAYFYRKGNDMFFKCHKCMASWTLAHFLKEFDFSVYEQYTFERYKNGENSHSNYKKPDFETFFNFPLKPKKLDVLGEYLTVSKLSEEHYAREYVENRKIPKVFYRSIYFVPDFKELVEQVDPEGATNLKEDDPRLVFPFINKEGSLIAFQGRTFSEKGIRYITIKVDKNAPKIFGLDRVNPKEQVYVLEGPIDSMFLPNAIATAGAQIGTQELNEFKKRVFVFDNEKRKPAIVKAMIQMAEKDESLCIWPDTIEEKDINKMIMTGRSPSEILRIINNNTFRGISAKNAIQEWKRC